MTALPEEAEAEEPAEAAPAMTFSGKLLRLELCVESTSVLSLLGGKRQRKGEQNEVEYEINASERQCGLQRYLFPARRPH